MSGLQLTMIRRGESLVPSAPMFLEDLQSIPEGKEVFVTVKRARSTKHHRFYFAKLKAVIDAGFWDGDTDSLLGYIKLGIGHFTTVVDNASAMVSGKTLALAETVIERHGRETDEGRLARAVIELAGPKSYSVPKSISFESLGQDEFNDIDQRTDRFLAERLGVDVQQVRNRTAENATSPIDEPAENPRARIGGNNPPEEIDDASAEERPAPAAEPTKPEAPAATSEAEEYEKTLEYRLRAAAFELGCVGDLRATEAYWATMRQRDDIKILYRQAPQLLQQLVEAAKNRARGKLTEELFDNIVRTATEAASAQAGGQ